MDESKKSKLLGKKVEKKINTIKKQNILTLTYVNTWKNTIILTLKI